MFIYALSQLPWIQRSLGWRMPIWTSSRNLRSFVDRIDVANTAGFVRDFWCSAIFISCCCCCPTSSFAANAATRFTGVFRRRRRSSRVSSRTRPENPSSQTPADVRLPSLCTFWITVGRVLCLDADWWLIQLNVLLFGGLLFCITTTLSSGDMASSSFDFARWTVVHMFITAHVQDDIHAYILLQQHWCK